MSDQVSTSFRRISDRLPSNFRHFLTSFRSKFDILGTPLRRTMANLGYFSPMMTSFRTMLCNVFNRGLLHYDALFRTTPDNHVELSSVCGVSGTLGLTRDCC